MSSGRPHLHFTRTDLFLVRIWTRGATEDISAGADPNGEFEDGSTRMVEWRGTVQRAVDGEAHQFSSGQGLLDLLVAMLSNNKGR